MDRKGSISIEIGIILIIIVLIITSMVTINTEINEKVTTSISSENSEKLISETCDNLINNPGFPIKWNEIDNPYNITPGLAIIDENNQTIPNSVSYSKLIKLSEFYNNLVDYKLFKNQFKSSIILEPIESSISSVKIGDDISSSDVFSINRLVVCDFYSKFVLKNFKNNTKCNQNHELKEYCCDYFKIYSSWLDSYDYYLLIDENSYKGLKYSIDTTNQQENKFTIATSDKIYLNDILEKKISPTESSSIIFIHFKNESVNAVIVQIPKEFNKNQIKYDYFQKTQCNFILKASY